MFGPEVNSDKIKCRGVSSGVDAKGILSSRSVDCECGRNGGVKSVIDSSNMERGSSHVVNSISKISRELVCMRI